jgi:hypothetical protein
MSEWKDMKYQRGTYAAGDHNKYPFGAWMQIVNAYYDSWHDGTSPGDMLEVMDEYWTA